MSLLTAQNTFDLSSYIVARPTTAFLLIGGIILFISVFIGYLVGLSCAGRWNGNIGKARTVCMTIMGVVTFAALLVYGTSIYTFQAMILCAVCLYSSYSDIKTRQLDDFPHCIILAAGMIGHNTPDLIWMIVAGLVIGGIMLLVAIISRGGGIGGADIKFSAAAAFLLGFYRGTVGVTIGLITGVIIELIKKKNQKKNEGFPLVPYLSIGFMTAYFIK